MGEQTGIEWTDATWNPIVGCSVVSPGCTNCYAMKMAARIEKMAGDPMSSDSYRRNGQSPYTGLTQSSKGGPVWNGKVALAAQDTLTAPLRWKRGRKIFVNSMGDLFHESVPDAWIDRVFAVMALAPEHTFQVLTKRSKRMRKYFAGCDHKRGVDQNVQWDGTSLVTSWHRYKGVQQALRDVARSADALDRLGQINSLPLPNVWLGISAEDQTRADERVPDLLATPAAVRFVSAEPLLGPIEFDRRWLDGTSLHCEHGHVFPLVALDKLSYRQGPDRNIVTPICGECGGDAEAGKAPRLDLIIVGGESGPAARPMPPQWARDIRDQCTAAEVAYFHKQNGEFLPATDPYDGLARVATSSGPMVRVGKKRAGRELDGRTHDDLPWSLGA